ncbi:MAG: nucleolar RNA-binding Nop10p family protein [Nanoarchaeota archaeon]
MKLNKCLNNHYTLKDNCPICNEKTQSAHYKFLKIKPAVKNNKN